MRAKYSKLQAFIHKPYFPGVLLLCMVVLLIIVGAVVYHLVENLDWLDSIFFAVITATTVGYGNIAPHTAAGKIFTIIYIFLSILLIFSFINHLSMRSRQKSLFKRFFAEKDNN